MTQPARLLAERQPDPTGRSWAFVPYDQLTDKLGPLARRDPRDTGKSTTLFHSRVSSRVNLHRLLPSQVVADVLAMNAPLQSKEGFVRQVLGWREFVHHVHVATADRKTERGAVRRPRRQYTLR